MLGIVGRVDKFLKIIKLDGGGFSENSFRSNQIISITK